MSDFGYATHEVSEPAAGAGWTTTAFATDPTLRRIVEHYDAGWAAPRLHVAGRTVGSAQVQELARQANRNLPELRTHDRFGNRADRIDFHPAWHDLMALAVGQEMHALCWTTAGPGAQVARAGLSYLWNQAEKRHLLSAGHDVFVRAGAEARSGALGRMGPTGHVGALRSPADRVR